MRPRSTSDRLSRRAALRLFGSAAGIALLAACGPAMAPAAPPSTAASAAPKPTTAAAQPTAAGAAAPTTAPATQTSPALNDPAAKAGFIPVGVNSSSPDPVTPPKGQPKPGGTLVEGNLGDLPNL